MWPGWSGSKPPSTIATAPRCGGARRSRRSSPRSCHGRRERAIRSARGPPAGRARRTSSWPAILAAGLADRDGRDAEQRAEVGEAAVGGDEPRPAATNGVWTARLSPAAAGRRFDMLRRRLPFDVVVGGERGRRHDDRRSPRRVPRDERLASPRGSRAASGTQSLKYALTTTKRSGRRAESAGAGRSFGRSWSSSATASAGGTSPVPDEAARRRTCGADGSTANAPSSAARSLQLAVERLDRDLLSLARSPDALLHPREHVVGRTSSKASTARAATSAYQAPRRPG